MGFPWYTKTDEDGTIDWETVGKSFEKYFKNINEEDQCFVAFGEGEIYVFEYSDMKFENEDQWEKEEEL